MNIETTTFKDFELSNAILSALSDMKFETPSDIQTLAIPRLRHDTNNFVCQAQTGTGKTAAFLIPLLEKLDEDSKRVQALIITPTRELAQQVENEVFKIAKYKKIKSTVLYGGSSYQNQIQSLKNDRPQIVVGTPGRILDFLKKRILVLDNCQQLILDEADEMLNMGFIEDIEEIIDYLPEEKQLWLFSATVPKRIEHLINSKFDDVEYLTTKFKANLRANIKESYCVIDKRRISVALHRLLLTNPDFYGIIFCETKAETERISEKLISLGHKAVAFNGDHSQAQRNNTIRSFKEGNVRILVCTDVAARGIDVTDLTHVVNLGVPRTVDSYTHRIGRTGRAGASGVAVTFIGRREVYELRRLERERGQVLEQYELADSSMLKQAIIDQELQSFVKIKEALVEKGEEFDIDERITHFEKFFEGLSKEDALKIVFAQRFRKSFREINEQEMLLKQESQSEDRGRRPSGRGGRPGGRGGRSDSRGRSGSGSRGRFESRGGRSDSRGGRPGGRSESRGERSDSRDGYNSRDGSESRGRFDSRKRSDSRGRSGEARVGKVGQSRKPSRPQTRTQ